MELVQQLMRFLGLEHDRRLGDLEPEQLGNAFAAIVPGPASITKWTLNPLTYMARSGCSRDLSARAIAHPSPWNPVQQCLRFVGVAATIDEVRAPCLAGALGKRQQPGDGEAVTS